METQPLYQSPIMDNTTIDTTHNQILSPNTSSNDASDADNDDIDEKQPRSMEELFTRHRDKWTKTINDLNEQMKSLPKLNELMDTIYSTRQNAVDYFYALNTLVIKRNTLYKKHYNDMFNNVKMNGYNGIRFGTDTNIAKCIESELGEEKLAIDLLGMQMGYIKETISTIDNMIYGINQKVKVNEMLNGLKY